MSSSKSLNGNEKNKLKNIIKDLEYLSSFEEINISDVDDILDKLKSEEAKIYLNYLLSGSKPETALREAFFAGNSVLGKYLYGSASPEVVENGFVDYLIKDQFGHVIVLELKSLFISIKDRDKSGRIIVKKLKQQRLNWESHKEQIKNYISKGEYVILSNLKEWIFFSRSLNPRNPKPFYFTTLSELIKDYEVIGNLKDYCDRKESQTIRYELDKKFLESLKEWVKKLSEVEFIVDDRRKLELIIGLINKFIFIQTLDDYGVIEFKWIQKNWEHYNNAWISKGKLKVLEEFFKYVDNWFYEYYDTELFKENFLQYIKKDPKNIDILYKNLQMVLGLTYLQIPIEFKGIMQYNFRLIDEDVLGKAYETFLAEQRKEKGAFYTPKYITEFIVENTVGKIYDELLTEIKSALESENFDEALELVKKFTSVRVLDPACGSASFLIKALRKIKAKYDELIRVIEEIKRKYLKHAALSKILEANEKINKLNKITSIIGPMNSRELISRIIIRHIHGNDLDKRALEVAKVNIWLEAIKLAPSDFRYDKLPSNVEHVLPNLEMNFGNGDSLVGLPEHLTIKILQQKHKDKIIKLFKLRNTYLEDPTQTELIDEVKKIIAELEKELDKEFEFFLKRNNLPLDIIKVTKPFHWILKFWYIFFNENGEPLAKEEGGFDVIIGNPPYFTIRGKGIGTLKQTFYYEYLQKSEIWKDMFRSHSDIYYYFTIFSANMLRRRGKFGFIIENYWLENDYADRMKEVLLSKTILDTLVHFGNIKIFDDAENDTCILLFQKELDEEKRENNQLKVIFCKKTLEGRTRYEQNVRLMQHILKNFDKKFYCDEFIDIFLVDQRNLGTGKWILSTKNKILDKMKKDGVRILPLGDLDEKIKEEFPNEFIENEGRELVGVAIIAQGMSPGVKKIFSLSSKEVEKLKIEKEVLKPLVINSDISRYFLPAISRKIIYPRHVKELEKYPGLKKYLENHKAELLKGSDRKKLLERGKIRWFDYNVYRNYEIYEKEKIKILCPYRAEENTFALDEIGYFGTTDIYAIVLKKDKKLDIKFLLGILNSKLLTFWYAEAGKRKGIMFEYFTTPLKRMPIRVATPEQQKPVIELVDKIIILKKSHYKLLELWNEWSTKLKNSEFSLRELLLRDVKLIRIGKFEQTITSKVSFYPNQEHEILNKKFKTFRITANTKKLVLKIYGLDEDNNEELVYEMEFRSKDILLHVYLSLLKALHSKVKIKTLSQLFTKTMIPIVKESNKLMTELISNIINMVKQEFESWAKENKIKNIKYDITKIDNEIEDIDAKIDAYVFKLYGLNEEEVKTVLDSLKVRPSYQQRVFEHFREINLNV